jgi:bacterioferritin (cytochrome b1)
MHGNKKVIEQLNAALASELTDPRSTNGHDS